MLRENIPAPPTGVGKLRWFGPGLLWMLSAVGTGSVLFTPRVASAYRYELLWLLLLVVFFMWVMIREMARFSIATGQTMMQGMDTLPGPRGWAVWVVFVPQLLAAAVGVAGVAAVAGSALQDSLPGNTTFWGIALVLACNLFLFTGHYHLLERVSQLMAIVLLGTAIVSAVAVWPGFSEISPGLVPGWPDDPEIYIIMPWVGTILAGSMGIVWFGYWTATRGFGGGLIDQGDEAESVDGDRGQEHGQLPHGQHQRNLEHANGWMKIATDTATTGVVGGLVVLLAFMVLGAELLAPEGILPEGAGVATDLARLFSDVWGEAGRYILLVTVVIALGGSVMADQDGWSRSFADMTLILRGGRDGGPVTRLLKWLQERTGRPMLQRGNIQRIYLLSITGAIPVTIIAVFEDPVGVMSVSGIVAAIHTPFIVLLTLYVNRSRLPEGIRPNLASTLGIAAAGVFYLGFAGVYCWDLLAG